MSSLPFPRTCHLPDPPLRPCCPFLWHRVPLCERRERQREPDNIPASETSSEIGIQVNLLLLKAPVKGTVRRARVWTALHTHLSTEAQCCDFLRWHRWPVLYLPACTSLWASERTESLLKIQISFILLALSWRNYGLIPRLLQWTSFWVCRRSPQIAPPHTGK